MAMNSPIKTSSEAKFHDQHGCVWFEEDAHGFLDPNANGGWYSISGKEPVRFKSWRDLPDGIVWWSNLTKHQAWALGKMHRFKDGSFFGPEWNALIIENNRFGNKENIQQAVQIWSETFARCAEWLSAWSARHTPELPWEWGDGSVSDVLAQRLGWSDSRLEEPQPILQAAYVEKIEHHIPSKFSDGKRKLLLAFPRVDHAKRMWTNRYPEGNWVEVSEWPKDKKERVEWIKSNHYPLLVRIVNIEWREENQAEGMLWLGMRGRRFQAAEFEPVWVTGEEAKVLNTFAYIEADVAYQAPGWATLEKVPDWAIDSEDPLVGLSISQSLLATSLFDAASMPARDPKKRKKSYYSSRSIWWRANDRMRCFRAALEFHKKGWHVLDFGCGQVTILFDPNEKVDNLVETIDANNLLMPALLAHRVPLKMDADHTNLVHVNRWIKEVGGNYPLVDVDRLVAPWSGNSVKVQGVLESAAKKLSALSPPNKEWQKWWYNALTKQARSSVDRILVNKNKKK